MENIFTVSFHKYLSIYKYHLAIPARFDRSKLQDALISSTLNLDNFKKTADLDDTLS